MSKQPPPPSDQVVAALQSGRLLEAVKLLLAQGSQGAGEAREMLEARRHTGRPERHDSPPPLYQEGLSPGEVPRSEEGGRTLLIIVIAAVAAYLLFFR